MFPISAPRYNIMTSCDDALAPYVAVTILSISHSMPDSHIDFFLLYHRVSQQNLELLYALCEKCPNITFHQIFVSDQELEPFSLLSRYGGWPEEAYFPAGAHLLLPDTADLDRIMYLDAGDTLVVKDISPYYTYDFQGNVVTATGISYKTEHDRIIPYTADDLYDWQRSLPRILDGLFNSGSYVINLDQLRQVGLSMDDLCGIAESIVPVSGGPGKKAYWGDQGFLSLAFVGNIRYYDFDHIQNVWHMPYNFCMWYFDHRQQRPDFDPAVIHYTGAPKPWACSYLNPVKRFQPETGLLPLSRLKFGQAEFYYLWHEYALMTDQLLDRPSCQYSAAPAARDT